MNNTNYYATLEVVRTASNEVIKGAYKHLSQKWHPDKQPVEKRGEAERAMKAINEAYAVLSDRSKRDAYDSWLAQEEGRSGPPNTDSGTKSKDGLSESVRLLYAKSIARGSWPVALVTSTIAILIWFALLTLWDWFDNFAKAHNTFIPLILLFLVVVSANAAVDKKRNDLLRIHDDKTLTLLYEQSSRRRFVYIISAVILAAGGIIAFAVLQNQSFDSLKSKSASTEEAASSSAEKDVRIVNECNRMLEFLIAFNKDGGDDWTIVPFYFAGKKDSYLSIDGVRLHVNAKNAFWYAKSSDGTLAWRAKDDQRGQTFEINGTPSDRFLALENGSGKELIIKISCS